MMRFLLSFSRYFHASQIDVSVTSEIVIYAVYYCALQDKLDMHLNHLIDYSHYKILVLTSTVVGNVELIF